ncbi:MAG: glycosyl hydrolase family 28-related protein, partial [Armatimonadota bacterium]|nr:glycosyl hydrolase family 28-related protein [Armatimonadota bacterium]
MLRAGSFIFLAFIFTFGALSVACGSTGVVNVQDFGAKGDGVTDDTKAICAAAKAAGPSSFQSTMGLHYQIGPVLVFPSGRYLVSDEIQLNCLEVRGEGRAVLVQSDKSKDILKNSQTWRMKISNLTFMGGKNQIDLRNTNIDTGQVIIDHCRFHQASGFGLYTDVLSTTVKVNDCEFFFCRQTWYNGRSDQAIMSDSWITTNKDTEDKAVIEHRGVHLVLSNI